jgi:hypothetical protein
MSIEEAVKKGLIKVIIKSKGGYTGNIITMKVANVSNGTLSLKVETGRRLDSKDDTQQDILITKHEDIMLASGKQQSYNIFGMCCQAHNSSPREKADYSIGKMADSNLVKIAEFIEKNKYFENFTAQQAVWTISDNNSIANIEDGDKEVVTDLRKYVSLITGRPIPTYDLIYKQQNDDHVLGRAVRIEAICDFSLNLENKVTMGIYNSEGRLVQLIFEKQAHSKGNYKIFYTFKTLNLPAGKYYTRVMTEGAVLKEDLVEF